MLAFFCRKKKKDKDYYIDIKHNADTKPKGNDTHKSVSWDLNLKVPIILMGTQTSLERSGSRLPITLK